MPGCVLLGAWIGPAAAIALMAAGSGWAARRLVRRTTSARPGGRVHAAGGGRSMASALATGPSSAGSGYGRFPGFPGGGHSRLGRHRAWFGLDQGVCHGVFLARTHRTSRP